MVRVLSTPKNFAHTVHAKPKTDRRRSTRESKQFVPYSGEDFTIKNEKKKEKKKEVKKNKNVVKRVKGKPNKTKKEIKKVAKGGIKKTTKPVKEKKVSKKGNDRLVPRPDIKFKREHPVLGDATYVCTRSLSRNLLAAVLKKDLKLIDKIYADKRLPKDAAGHHYSDMDNRSPLMAAFESGNEKLISALLKAHRSIENDESRDIEETNILQRKSTGRRNFHMLGRHTRAIEISRGGREGNNAFINYEPDYNTVSENILTDSRMMNIPFHVLLSFSHPSKGDDWSLYTEFVLINQVITAMRNGNRELANHFAQLQKHNFNVLQLECLKDKGKFPKQILAISVRKKCFMFSNITPAHTAAINPDPSFIAALRDVDPMINVPDNNNWYTTHYAAACEGDGPLKYLISKDIGVCDITKKGELPLHIAAKTGRTHNVKVLLEAIAKMEKKDTVEDNDGDETEDDDDEPRAKKAKKTKTNQPKSLVNAKTRKGRTALHYAVWHGRTEVVRLLLNNPAVDKECPNSATDKKLTPLMIAAGRGHLELCELLIKNGCLVESRDKLKRSPLIIATMNGQTNIAAMLLNLGADVNRKDSSGNTAMHYACAYGWIDIVRLLIEVDVQTLTAKNEWLLTPLSVAYLKSHYGIVSYLLDNHSDVVDINCKDNEGVTLISSLISYHDENSTSSLPSQIEYLIKHGADCSIVDTAGDSPLHKFASVPIVLKVENPTREIEKNDERITSRQYKKCIEQLITANADPLVKNAAGATPFSEALSSGNLYLASIFFDTNGKELLNDTINGSNVLHSLFKLPFVVLTNRALWAYTDSPIGGQYNIVPLLKKIIDALGLQKVGELLTESNNEGDTPVIQLCQQYSSMDRNDMAESQMGAFAATIMAVIRECLLVRPQSIFDRKKKPSNTGALTPEEESKLLSVIDIGLNNRSSSKGKNVLLESLINCATENDTLGAFLDHKVNSNKASCPVTALIKALLNRQEREAILILKAANENGMHKEVNDACIETRRSDGNEEPVQESVNHRSPRVRVVARRSPSRFAKSRVAIPFGGMNNGINGQSSTNQSTTPYSTQVEPWNKTAFHIAIEYCLLETIPHFILTKEQAAAKDADGRNAWHYAAAQLAPSTVTLFEKLEQFDVPIVHNSLGQNPLHVAVNAEITGSADAFLDPIEWLLQKDDVSAKDGGGRTALHYAFVKKDGKYEDVTVEKKDPIAVVSLLLNAMNPKTIQTHDSEGNTALHLAAMANANICAVSMLAKGAEVDAKNNDSNTPLAIALLFKSQAIALTLIQAHADISGPVLGPIPNQIKQNEWRFVADSVSYNKRIESTIPAVVVRNEWHSLVYVILDLLGKTPDTISQLIAAALQNEQHNFSIYLLKLLGKPTPEVKKAIRPFDFLRLFVESLSGGPMEGSAITALDRILELGVECIDDKGQSPVIQIAAEKGHYALLQKLLDHDIGFTRFKTLKPLEDGSTPILSLMKRWLESDSSNAKTEGTQLMAWIHRFRALPCFSLSKPIPFPKRALPGLSKELWPIETEMILPLTAAIRAQDPYLVHFLLTCGVDVNDGKRPPIIDAVITNHRGTIKVLVDDQLEKKKDLIIVPPLTNGVIKSKTRHTLFVRATVRREAPPTDEEIANGSVSSPFANGVSSMQSQYQTIRNATDDDEEDEDDDMNGDGDDTEDEENNDVNKTIKPIELRGARANLDVTAIDESTGRNLCHFLVEPCGWQNVELLEAFSKAYKSKISKMLTTVDKEGQSPIALAAKNNQWRMHSAMVKLAAKPTTETPKGIIITVPAPTTKNVREDADALTKEFGSTLSKNKEEKKKHDPRTPHVKSDYEKTGEIVLCTITNQLFKVLMNKTDMRGGMNGFHNFYRMELIKRKDADLFILFTHWGRIGDAYGEFQCTPFTSLPAAEKEFRSVYKQKTGQEWAPFDEFDEKPGKYRLTKTEDGVETAEDIEVDQFIPRKEDEGDNVISLMNDIGNVKMLKRYAHEVRLTNNHKAGCPFGRISRQDIEKAKLILDKLRKNHVDIDKARQRRPPNMNDIYRYTDDQYQLTSEFYTTIPIGGFERSSIHVISSAHELNHAENMLRMLGEIEIAGRLISSAAYARLKRGEDPLRYMLSAVECDITPLSPKSELAQRTLQWISVTKKNRQISCIYSICPRGPAEAFTKHTDCTNMMYLLHGTRAENVLSIMHYGLKATPANALQCGQAFGSGVYLADTFTKSEGYCGQSTNGMNYMLVCKVALGKVLEKDDLSEKDRFDTRKVNGHEQPDKNRNLIVDGVEMPLGSLVKYQSTTNQYRWCPPYTEYIVKDEKRILPCMLITFK